MSSPTSRPEVSGGATSIDASLQDMRAHAGHLDRRGDDARRLARDVTALSMHLPMSSAILSPVTAAAVGRQVTDLLLGTSGLTGLAVRLELLARGLRLTADAYARVDASRRTAFELIQIPVGGLVVLGTIQREAGEAASASVETRPELWVRPHLWPLAAEDTAHRFTLGLVESVYLEPDLTNSAVSGARAFVPGVRFETEVAGLVLAARAVGLLRDDRPLEVRPSTARADRPVRDLGGLLDTQQAILSTPDQTDQGTRVRAQRVLGDDGRHRWVVNVPGTQDWSPDAPANPSDMAANAAGVADLPSTLYPAISTAVAQAMRAAGVRPGQEPVMLAGHSQGGLVAARLAADPTFRHRFRVTSVVAAAAPVSRVEIPRAVRVLAIEHRRDFVPRLDARDDAGRSNRVRVLLDATPAPGVRDDPATVHRADRYARSARAQLAPHGRLDPQLRQWYSDHDRFLNGTSATSYDTVIRRPP